MVLSNVILNQNQDLSHKLLQYFVFHEGCMRSSWWGMTQRLVYWNVWWCLSGVILFCVPRGMLGSLRLQLRLRDETVLPSSHYQPLTELLCQSVGSHVNVSLSIHEIIVHHHSLAFISIRLRKSGLNYVLSGIWFWLALWWLSRATGQTWSCSSMRQPQLRVVRKWPTTWSSSSWVRGCWRSSWMFSSNLSWTRPVSTQAHRKHQSLSPCLERLFEYVRGICVRRLARFLTINLLMNGWESLDMHDMQADYHVL